MKTTRTISEIRKAAAPMLEETRWIIDDHESYGLAINAREALGHLPHKLRKTYVQFDNDETRTYGGVEGGRFATLATRLVLASKDKRAFLKSLKGLAMAFVEPLKAYLRVKLAMTRLEAVMDEAVFNVENGPSTFDVPDIFSENSGRTQNEGGERERACRPGLEPGPRETKRQTSDSFEDINANLGYDVRDTSVYWIEKKAARLKRQWAAYGSQGASTASRYVEHRIEDARESIVRHRTIDTTAPLDADYNTIWPPMEFPDAPPKVKAPVTPASEPGPREIESGDDMALPNVEIPDICDAPLPWPSSSTFDSQDRMFAAQPPTKSGMTEFEAGVTDKVEIAVAELVEEETCHPGLAPGPREVACEVDTSLDLTPITNIPALHTNRKARRAALKAARTQTRNRAPP